MNDRNEAHSPGAAEQEPNPWNIYGPFFHVEVVARELGMNETEVREMIADRVLLGLETADGSMVVPAKQFIIDDEGNIDIPINLPSVLSVWDEERLDGWSFLGALASPQTWLDGRTIFETIRDGQHLDEVVEEIDSWMRRLGH